MFGASAPFLAGLALMSESYAAHMRALRYRKQARLSDRVLARWTEPAPTKGTSIAVMLLSAGLVGGQFYVMGETERLQLQERAGEIMRALERPPER